jgi:hypothetical protein
MNYGQAIVFNTISTLLPYRVQSDLGFDQWVPEPAPLFKWWSLCSEDTDGLHVREEPSLARPRFFSGILGGFGDVGACIVLVLLAVALVRSTFRVRVPGFSPVAVWIFLSLGLIANIATIRWSCESGVVSQNLHLYVILLLIAVFAQLSRLPTPLRLVLFGLILASSMHGILAALAVESVPVHFHGNNPILPGQTDVFVWHIKNAEIKATNGLVLLYDECGAARAFLAISALLASGVSIWWAAKACVREQGIGISRPAWSSPGG